MKPLTRYDHAYFENSRMVEDENGDWYAKDEADARIRELEPAAKWFGEVMAAIHGDGGHYVTEHGVEKSALDAVAKFRELETSLATLKAECKTLASAALKGMKWSVYASELRTERDAARAECERLRDLLSTARDYVAGELHQERINFKGHEHASNIASIEADLASIDAAIDAARDGQPLTV